MELKNNQRLKNIEGYLKEVSNPNMEKETKHWATSLQEGDYVFATIRHETDGSKNRHNVKLRVIDVDLKKKQIKGVENGSFYFVTFNELYQSPKQDQRNLEKETEKHILDTLFTLETLKSKSHVHITQKQAYEVLALKSERDRLEKVLREIDEEISIWGLGNQDSHNTVVGIHDIMAKAGLLKPCPNCKNIMCSCYDAFQSQT